MGRWAQAARKSTWRAGSVAPTEVLLFSTLAGSHGTITSGASSGPRWCTDVSPGVDWHLTRLRLRIQRAGPETGGIQPAVWTLVAGMPAVKVASGPTVAINTLPAVAALVDLDFTPATLTAASGYGIGWDMTPGGGEFAVIPKGDTVGNQWIGGTGWSHVPGQFLATLELWGTL